MVSAKKIFKHRVIEGNYPLKVYIYELIPRGELRLQYTALFFFSYCTPFKYNYIYIYNLFLFRLVVKRML